MFGLFKIINAIHILLNYLYNKYINAYMFKIIYAIMHIYYKYKYQ